MLTDTELLSRRELLHLAWLRRQTAPTPTANLLRPPGDTSASAQ